MGDNGFYFSLCMFFCWVKNYTHQKKKTEDLLIADKEKVLEVGTETSNFMLVLTSENMQDNVKAEVNNLKI